MKKFIISLLLVSHVSFAQDYSDILYHRGRSLGRDVQTQIKETQTILSRVQEILDSADVRYQIQNFKDGQNNTYPALVLSTLGTHALNREAARVASVMSGMPLVFSPYDLGRSQANAFYDPKGTMIGVSYYFILGQVADPSYQHELYHANTYAQLVRGLEMEWAGLKTLKKGSAMTSRNRQYYFRHASLDELPATALSLQLDTQKLIHMKAKMDPRSFAASRGEGEDMLGDVYMSILAGEGLARQVQDVVAQALETPKYSAITEQMRSGNSSRRIHSAVFSLKSHDRVFSNGRGSDVLLDNGMELKLQSNRPFTQAIVKARLESIYQKALKAEQAFVQAKKCIYVLIEYPDVTRTDYQCLQREAPKAFSALR